MFLGKQEGEDGFVYVILFLEGFINFGEKFEKMSNKFIENKIMR